jgi:hypothetical protein
VLRNLPTVHHVSQSAMVAYYPPSAGRAGTSGILLTARDCVVGAC